MAHDNKKIAAMIVAGKPEGHDDSEHEMEGPDAPEEHSEGEMEAANEIMAAFHDKDPKALAQALKNFWMMIDID